MLPGAVQRKRRDLRADLQVRAGLGEPLLQLLPIPLLRGDTLARGGERWGCWGAGLIPTGSPRSRTCCRHFLLAQLRDGRHVVLGEDSAHARLQDLLRHYSGSPLSPYGETLSQPLARQVPDLHPPPDPPLPP